MRRALDRLSAGANSVTEWLLAPILGFFTVLLILAVISRYAFQLPIVEAVEMTRIAFVWACFLGAAAGLRRHAHIRVTVLVDRLPLSLRPLGAAASFLAFMAFAALMVWHGILLTQRMTVTTFPTLQISQGWLYLALPVSGALMVLHSLAGLATVVAAWRTPIEGSRP